MVQPRRTKTSTRDPYKTKYSSNIGDRIPHAEKVAREDPARAHILITLNQMELAGVEIDERAVEIADKLGRWRHDSALEREPVVDGGVPRWQRSGKEADIDRPSWVYYVRCGHLIKIGTTVDLATRFTAIRPNEVLALEPGGLIVENERHREFAQLQASGEYFHPGSSLQQHILVLRRDFGPPTWTGSLVPDGQNFFPAA